MKIKNVIFLLVIVMTLSTCNKIEKKVAKDFNHDNFIREAYNVMREQMNYRVFSRLDIYFPNNSCFKHPLEKYSSCVSPFSSFYVDLNVDFKSESLGRMFLNLNLTTKDANYRASIYSVFGDKYVTNYTINSQFYEWQKSKVLISDLIDQPVGIETIDYYGILINYNEFVFVEDFGSSERI